MKIRRAGKGGDAECKRAGEASSAGATETGRVLPLGKMTRGIICHVSIGPFECCPGWRQKACRRFDTKNLSLYNPLTIESNFENGLLFKLHFPT